MEELLPLHLRFQSPAFIVLSFPAFIINQASMFNAVLSSPSGAKYSEHTQNQFSTPPITQQFATRFSFNFKTINEFRTFRGDAIPSIFGVSWV